MIHHFRRTAAVLMAAGCVCSVAACGSSSSSKTGTSSRSGFAGHGGAFAQLTSSERSCLSKHGLKLGAGGAGAHRPGGFSGKPGNFKGKPGQFKGKRPSFHRGGKVPKGGYPHRGAFGGGTFEKAMKACGVKVPSFGRGGAGSGAPGAGSTGSQTSSAS